MTGEECCWEGKPFPVRKTAKCMSSQHGYLINHKINFTCDDDRGSFVICCVY